MLHSASLQNPTEWRWNSPFFGSVLLRFLLVGTAVDRIGDHEVRVCDWGKKEYRYCGFLVKTIILSRCKRLGRSARICLKLPRLNPPRGSSDNAAIAARLGGSSKLRSAVRARKRRERTVFSGSCKRSEISA